MEWQGVSVVQFIREFGELIHCAHIKGVQVAREHTRAGLLGGHRPMGHRPNGWNFVTAGTARDANSVEEIFIELNRVGFDGAVQHRVGGQRRRAARRGEGGAGQLPRRRPAQRHAARRDAEGVSPLGEGAGEAFRVHAGGRGWVPRCLTQEDAFLRAIIERPEDEAGFRLVFADWLEDHGRPDRAEFIRGQCGLAGQQEWDEGRAPPLASPLFPPAAVEPQALVPGALNALARLKDWHARRRSSAASPNGSRRPRFASPNTTSALFSLAPLRGAAFEDVLGEDIHAGFWGCPGLKRLRKIWIFRSGHRHRCTRGSKC